MRKQDSAMRQQVADRKTKSASTPRQKRYQPWVGNEFDVDEVPAQDEDTSTQEDGRIRGIVARSLLLFAGAAIAVTGCYGLLAGNYTALQAVWSVAGPPVGAVIGYYFGSAH